MPTRFDLTTEPIRPLRLLLLALMMTFIGEYVIMRLMPYLLPAGIGETHAAIADACLLTVFVTPVLWVVAVRPIERLAESRMHFLRRALTSQEEERRRITQDLHDGLGQSLTSLMLGLRAMEETTTDQRVCEQASTLRTMGAAIHDDLRRIVRGLRPAILDQLGLVAAIERLVDDVRHSGGPSIDYHVKGMDRLRLNQDLETTAFRIVQEAVSNAVRHSMAEHLQVSLTVHERELELRISDDGKGFDGSTIFSGGRFSYGLLGIRERAMISGGRAEILTRPDEGTTVTAHLPLSIRTANHE
ncbi:MAG: sensor histidine kinase [Planctomyces sp.]|nr:sensor histidine kinase [Planctomyces sp.]